MKKIFLLVGIVLSSLIYTNKIHAQTTQTKLNQVELMKQFLGNWKAEISKDTIRIMECKSFYNAFEFYLKTKTKGKVIYEQKALAGYDEKNDKIIESAIFNDNPNLILMTAWFTSVNKCEEVLFKDIANPDKAKYKWIFEFKSPDLLIWTDMVNNKPTKTYTFNRAK